MRKISVLVIFLYCIYSTSSYANETNTENKRIVVLAPNLVEIIYALNLEKHIVAVSEHSDYPMEAKTLPRVGNYLSVDLEKIITLNPSKIIVWQGGTPQKEISKLTQLGFDVIYFEASTAEEMIDEIRRLGTTLSANNKATELANKLSQQLSDIKTKYANLPKLNGFVEVWANPLTSAGRHTIVDQVMQICGVTNVIKTNGTYPQVDLEWLINQNFDVILQPVSHSQPTTLFDWTRYQQIAAVNKGAIINVDADILLRWTPRWINGLENVCKNIDRLGR